MSKMFKSKQQVDSKKLQAKLFDIKKDCFSRLRYLRELLETRELPNEKQFFYNHRSVIYGIFYDAFIQLDASKSRSTSKGFGSISELIGADGLNSTQREEYGLIIGALERMLLLLPEVLEMRWQLNSIVHVFRKMLHYSNVIRVRIDGMRLFLIYYQILGERTIRECPQLEVLYASLVPGIVSDLCPNLNPRNAVVTAGPITTVHLSEEPDLSATAAGSPSVHYGPMQPYPNEPLIPMLDHSSAFHLVASPTSLSGTGPSYHQPAFEYKLDIQQYFLDRLMEYSLSECSKILWPDYRDRRSQRAFEFLMYTFARIYLPYIFPQMAAQVNVDSKHKTWPQYTIHPTISVYKPPDRIPTLRRYSDHLKQHYVYQPPSGTHPSPRVQLQSSVVLWFTKYLVDKEKTEGRDTLTQSSVGIGPSGMFDGVRASSMAASTGNLSTASGPSPYPTQQSASYLATPTPPTSTTSDQMEREYIRALLNSKRLYVDLILSLFHEALLLPFSGEAVDPSSTSGSTTNRTPMRNVIKVYRQWIHKETTSPLPLFLSEPNAQMTPNSSPASLGSRYGHTEDSVAAGLMNTLNVFILSTANVFLLEIPSEQSTLLDLQVDVCKRVFNIYRFMVMKVDMDRTVWENLVQVLIQVTRSIVSAQVPTKREDTLGGRLAPALFQTLIVTWIKANLNVPVSPLLWEHFHLLVSSLTKWEELIQEWSNTMYILNRVMSRYVFNINLSDLPLEKMGHDGGRKRRMTIAAKAAAGGGGTKAVQGAKEGGHRPAAVDHQISITSTDSSQQQQVLQRQSSTDQSATSRGHGRTRPSTPYHLGTATFHLGHSVQRHRQFHDTTSVLKLVHGAARMRSLSDSCLLMPVQAALCPLRRRGGLVGGGGSAFGGRSKRASQKSSSKTSPRQVIRHGQGQQPRHLPMIDDDEVESCTIMDGDMATGSGHGHIDADYSDASSIVDSTVGDAWDLPNEFPLLSQGIYGKPRGLYRSYSAEDVYVVPIGAGRDGRHWSIWSESFSLGGTTTGEDQPLGFESTGGGFGTTGSNSCSNSVHSESMSLGSSPSSGSRTTTTTSSTDSLPVLLGGSHKGWNATISVILWRRMLGVLGDLNDIPDPAMHKLAFECLVKITDDFIKMKDNLSYLSGIQGPAGSSDQIQLQPSLHYFTAWLFRATTLPNEFKAGKLLAYKLLCIIALHRCEQTALGGPPEPANRDFLILFYLAIKRALATYDMELTCIIIKYCGQKFFSSALYGSSCLLFDFISAANMIVSSQETKWPRAEALHLLGSLIGFFDVYSNVLILRNTTSAKPSLETYKDLKEHVLEILIIASKREQTGLGRSIALCSLGIFLYKEFQSRAEHHRLKEIVNILIAGTRVSVKRPKHPNSPTSRASPNHLDNTSKFNNRVLCRVACDQLRLQTDHAAYLVEKHPDMARRIIEGLCYTLSLHIEVVQQQNIFKEFKNLLISIQFTLAHWCMSVAKDFLTGTAVSCDYPNFVDAETNAKRSAAAASAEEQRPPPAMTLLQLVISVYSSIANLDVGEILNRRVNERQLEALNASNSFSDMDTIDYTVQRGGGGPGPDVADGVTFSKVPPSTTTDTRSADAYAVKRAAQMILAHFLTFIGHFPVPKLRTTSLCALINEADDNPCTQPADKLELESLNCPNVLMFVVGGSAIVSFVELDTSTLDSAILAKLTAATGPGTSSPPPLNLIKQRPIRIIIRNLLGRFAWNCIALQSPLLPEVPRPSPVAKPRPEPMIRSIATASNGHYQRSLESNLDRLDDDDEEEDDQDSSKWRNPRKDSLERIIGEIYQATPECQPTEPENGSFLQGLNGTAEAVDIVALFTNQHYQERQFHEEQRYRKSTTSTANSTSSRTASITSSTSTSTLTTSSAIFTDPSAAFTQCRQLIEQTGFLSWEKRASIDLLAKSPAMLRELRHLDGQRCRETHKIAVIYVAPGQESKEAILGNKAGSRAFEEFVGRLGWEVNLASHAGFMGGLEANLSTGLTAPYFADAFNEVIFHVSTRLEPVPEAVVNGEEVTTNAATSPERSQQLLNKKMRHLGNDEVHIVWSEHYKEYRRTILATEFCDALIVIYPLPPANYPNLFRIQVSRKPEVPFFGPLFNGVVVHRDELASLVRATAINASRAKRLYMSAYKHYFEERYEAIASLAAKHRERSTFEEYATRVYAPRYDLLGVGTPTTDSVMTDSIGVELTPHPVLSIEQFLSTTGTVLGSLSLSPSNADSLSLASTTASTSVDAATPTQPTTPQFGAQHLNAHGTGHHQQGLPVRGASRPTSRSSFK